MVHLCFSLLKLSRKQVAKMFHIRLLEEDLVMQQHLWLIQRKLTTNSIGKPSMELKKCAKTTGIGQAETQKAIKIQMSQTQHEITKCEKRKTP